MSLDGVNAMSIGMVMIAHSGHMLAIVRLHVLNVKDRFLKIVLDVMKERFGMKMGFVNVYHTSWVTNEILKFIEAVVILSEQDVLDHILTNVLNA